MFIFFPSLSQSEIVRFIDSSAADLVAHPFEEAGGNSDVDRHGAVSGGNATRLSVMADADQRSANALLLWRLLKVLCVCRGGAFGGTAKSGCEQYVTTSLCNSVLILTSYVGDHG